jgi:hypothetical protein
LAQSKKWSQALQIRAVTQHNRLTIVTGLPNSCM